MLRRTRRNRHDAWLPEQDASMYNAPMPETIVSEDDAGLRADVYAARMLGVSRSQSARIISQGRVLVNGVRTKAGRILEAGDRVSATLPPPVPAEMEPETMPLNIVYEDAEITVINKPRGLVVHPAAGHQTGTLVNALLARTPGLSSIGGVERPGIVHRLDMGTSGLMVVAKTDAAHHSLQQQIQSRTACREYVAVAWGDPQFETATVDAAMGRHRSDRKKMAVLPAGTAGARRAVTEFSVEERFGFMCVLSARLLTGRTHQIRVHCAYIGHPVVGDATYGGVRKLPATIPQRRRDAVERALSALDGQALHAFRLSFRHPATDEPMTFEAQLPDDMTGLVTALRGDGEQQDDEEPTAKA